MRKFRKNVHDLMRSGRSIVARVVSPSASPSASSGASSDASPSASSGASSTVSPEVSPIIEHKVGADKGHSRGEQLREHKRDSGHKPGGPEAFPVPGFQYLASSNAKTQKSAQSDAVMRMEAHDPHLPIGDSLEGDNPSNKGEGYWGGYDSATLHRIMHTQEFLNGTVPLNSERNGGFEPPSFEAGDEKLQAGGRRETHDHRVDQELGQGLTGQNGDAAAFHQSMISEIKSPCVHTLAKEWALQEDFAISDIALSQKMHVPGRARNFEASYERALERILCEGGGSSPDGNKQGAPDLGKADIATIQNPGQFSNPLAASLADALIKRGVGVEQETGAIFADQRSIETGPEAPASPEVKASPEVQASPEAKGNPEVQASPEAQGNPEAKASPEAKANPEVKASPEAQGDLSDGAKQAGAAQSDEAIWNAEGEGPFAEWSPLQVSDQSGASASDLEREEAEEVRTSQGVAAKADSKKRVGIKGILREIREAANSQMDEGINALAVRFALLSAVCSIVCVALAQWVVFISGGVPFLVSEILTVVTLVAVPSTATFLVANRLTSALRRLRDSADRINAGEMNVRVDEEGSCEVGGLAKSFSAMVKRLNDNISRMNVLAYTDVVTELPNREIINHTLKQMEEEKCAGSVIFIDLDGFKQVNDSLGHAAGDEVLRQITQRIVEGALRDEKLAKDYCTAQLGGLQLGCPDGAVVARFAGDEFVVILPGDKSRETLQSIAGDIINEINEPMMIQGSEVRVSASIGIARAPKDTLEHTRLLSYADLAMYAAKKSGKGHARFFNDSLRKIATMRADIENDLRGALDRDEFILHYQPKVEASDYSLNSVEALVRWEHPEMGLVKPGAFIAIAESSGLMPEIGEVVMEKAVRQARIWAEAGQPRAIAVNVSPAQFESPNMARAILSLIDHYEVDPGLIEIEITESMVMSDFEESKRRLLLLRDAGIRISIDDFGTGYSNLSQLARLPFDVLKIDRSLTSDVGTNEKTEIIINSIVRMAKALGHEVVAEGIETQPQFAFLAKAGVDQIQGYLFGAPMSVEELEQWVEARGSNKIASTILELERKFS